MDLTVIIVNYNVKHFLYQSVDAALRALANVNGELIVVDNNSSDGSVEFIKKEFPSIQVIANETNTGFATANNQGVAIAQGDYCLLLNPDTIVAEDTFKKCVDYLNENKDVQGLGIKMIDGSGRFLPESKRSFPSPDVAFYKLFGLAKLFPNSTRFGQYHLSYLEENETNFVDVLSGAFLMARTKHFQKIGGLDEDFFMYGEDIDLSWRLREKGFKNVYFAGSQILHYKGESTKRGSLNYVKRFYQAMIIFAEKHFKGSKANLFIGLMKIAVYLRAGFTLLQNGIQAIRLKMIDFIVGFGLLYVFKLFWESIRFEAIHYPKEILYFNFPIYLVVFILSLFFSGGYDRPYQINKIIRGSFFGVLICAVLYAFFPDEYRFSRVFIFLSGFAFAIGAILVRMISQYLTTGNFSLYGSRKRSAIIIGNENSQHLSSDKILPPPFFTYLGLVCTDENCSNSIGNFSDIENIVNEVKPTDLLLDTEALNYADIVNVFAQYAQKGIKCHTALKGGKIIISSQSKNTTGNVFLKDNTFRIATKEERRKKRLLDIVMAIFALIFSPILILIQVNKKNFISNCINVLIGKKTWVGYDNTQLPKLKRSVLKAVKPVNYSTKEIQGNLEENYAKFYSVYEDIDLISKRLNELGND